VYWIASVIPAGLGHLHGQTEEYLNRLVQWRTIHSLTSSGTGDHLEVVTELFDAEWHGGLWQFKEKHPSRVEYSILPGVTILARWYQFPSDPP
jgi:hypothetical protein